MEKQATLLKLHPGETATVRGLSATGSMRRRLMDLGFIQGAEVFCIQRSPLGDPTAYGVLGAVIAVRGCDAETVLTD